MPVESCSEHDKVCPQMYSAIICLKKQYRKDHLKVEIYTIGLFFFNKVASQEGA